MSSNRELGSRYREAEASECDLARERAETMVRAALALVERFSYSPEAVMSALDYELRERLRDAAEDDAAFREWYRSWRNDNPGTG